MLRLTAHGSTQLGLRGRPVEEVRLVVDDIDRRVRSLLAELVGLVSEGRDDPPLQPEHWPAAVYQAGIVTGNATFETIAAA